MGFLKNRDSCDHKVVGRRRSVFFLRESLSETKMAMNSGRFGGWGGGEGKLGRH